MVVAISRSLGPVPIDVMLQERHLSRLSITRNPIEFGADVTDHAYVQPKDLWLWRPVLADPPLCTWREVCSSLNIDDLADMHEALDLREDMIRRTLDKARGK